MILVFILLIFNLNLHNYFDTFTAISILFNIINMTAYMFSFF